MDYNHILWLTCIFINAKHSALSNNLPIGLTFYLGYQKNKTTTFLDIQPKKGLKCSPYINQNTALLHPMDYVQEQLNNILCITPKEN